MKLRQLIRKIIKENVEKAVDFDFKDFPESVYNTYSNEYESGVYTSQEWNQAMSHYGSGPHFSHWLERKRKDHFINNIDKYIKQTTEDLITKKREAMAKKKLDYFEELIIPVIGDKALMPAISQFEAEAILNPNATAESIEKAFRDAKNIMDKHGNINPKKTNKSKYWFSNKGEINIAQFERLAKEDPEFQGVFDDWKKLFNNHTNLMVKDLHALRHSTSIDKIRNLRNFLIDFKKKHGL